MTRRPKKVPWLYMVSGHDLIIDQATRRGHSNAWDYKLHFILSHLPAHTGCSKSHETHGLLGICVSWTPHFKEIVASTIPGLKPPPRLMGASQGYCVFKSSTHTLCKSFRPTFSSLWTGYQLEDCKTCSLTWFVVCISVKSVMVDIFRKWHNNKKIKFI
jgi:hypothetical protein